jgi:hypothetical protein
MAYMRDLYVLLYEAPHLLPVCITQTLSQCVQGSLEARRQSRRVVRLHGVTQIYVPGWDT